MTMTDPVADLLTRIRNAQEAKHRFLEVPESILVKRILYVLKEEQFIKDFIIITQPVQSKVKVFLKYDHNDNPVVSYISRVSKPGRRVYAKADEIPKVLDGLGVAILTTSKGVISDKVARKLNIGGEILCNVY